VVVVVVIQRRTFRDRWHVFLRTRYPEALKERPPDSQGKGHSLSFYTSALMRCQYPTRKVQLDIAAESPKAMTA